MQIALTKVELIVGKKDGKRWLSFFGVLENGETVKGFIPAPTTVQSADDFVIAKPVLEGLRSATLYDVQFDQRGRVDSLN